MPWVPFLGAFTEKLSVALEGGPGPHQVPRRPGGFRKGGTHRPSPAKMSSLKLSLFVFQGHIRILAQCYGLSERHIFFCNFKSLF